MLSPFGPSARRAPRHRGLARDAESFDRLVASTASVQTTSSMGSPMSCVPVLVSGRWHASPRLRPQLRGRQRLARRMTSVPEGLATLATSTDWLRSSTCRAIASFASTRPKCWRRRQTSRALADRVVMAKNAKTARVANAIRALSGSGHRHSLRTDDPKRHGAIHCSIRSAQPEPDHGASALPGTLRDIGPAFEVLSAPGLTRIALSGFTHFGIRT